MTTEFVQSRLNPPILIPLEDPKGLPRETLKVRLQTMETLILPYRPFSPIEIEERRVLLALVTGEPLRKGRWFRRLPSKEEIEEELLS